jgi:hypothetical protein
VGKNWIPIYLHGVPWKSYKAATLVLVCACVSCNRWIEETKLSLEEIDKVFVTARERNPGLDLRAEPFATIQPTRKAGQGIRFVPLGTTIVGFAGPFENLF